MCENRNVRSIYERTIREGQVGSRWEAIARMVHARQRLGPSSYESGFKVPVTTFHGAYRRDNPTGPSEKLCDRAVGMARGKCDAKEGN